MEENSNSIKIYISVILCVILISAIAGLSFGRMWGGFVYNNKIQQISSDYAQLRIDNSYLIDQLDSLKDDLKSIKDKKNPDSETISLIEEVLEKIEDVEDKVKKIGNDVEDLEDTVEDIEGGWINGGGIS